MPRIPILIISLYFFIGAIAHFVFTETFIKVMPNYLGYHQELVIISSVFELLGAVGILISRTRLLAGYGLIALCAVVFPANINMAVHADQFSDIPVMYLYLRLPFQCLIVGFIWWTVKPDGR